MPDPFPPTIKPKKAMPLIPPAPANEDEEDLDPELKALLEDEDLWRELQENQIEPNIKGLWAYFVGTIGAISLAAGMARSSRQLTGSEEQAAKWKAGPDYARKYFEERGAWLVTEVSETDRAHIRQLLKDHWGEGEVRFARNITGDYLLDEKRAKKIYRTEMHNCNEAGAYANAFFNGGRFRVWISNGLNACPACHDMNGEVAPIDQPFSDGSYYAHKHPNCGCTEFFYTQAPTKEQLVDSNRLSQETTNEDFAALDKYVSIAVKDRPELSKKGEVMQIDLGDIDLGEMAL
jgi:hypothetical protein